MTDDNTTPDDAEKAPETEAAAAAGAADDAATEEATATALPGDADVLADAEAIVNGAADAIADEADPDDALAAAQAKAAEHLDDLQRLQAEFVNYRKRVDRDRAQAGADAQARVVEALLPVLDDIHAAREHGDLTGPFASISEKLEGTLAKLGWESFGAEGEAFDPMVHEALATQPSEEVTEPTITQVAQPGHRVGDRVVRPARVIVAQPQ